ncbi:MAG TPA: universal stress protein [Bradyrhizobium sp.]|nr:universal stress protein [Bradyrhizobium sp.]
MFKNLLVHIPTERSVRAAVDGSVSLALAHGARLDAMAIGYESGSIPFVIEGGAAVASIYEVEHQRAFERANVALGVFEAAAKTAGLSYGCLAVCGTFAETSSIISASARLHDLAIVTQPDTERDTYDNDIPQEILFEAGGPVLFLPHTFQGPFTASRIGICWDGSRQAARAVRDAMPFLAPASAIKVIALNEPVESPALASSAQLVARLASDGLPAKAIGLAAERADIQATILSLAADEDIDLLVMGGYGHTRLQERMIGGVTRDMLGCMTVPVLMSH